MSRFVFVILFFAIMFTGSSFGAKAEAVEDGFVSLFDGKTLSGWTGDAMEYFSVESGELVCSKGCSGNLLTEGEYADFVFRFDFKLTPGANNGVAIRAPLEGNPAFDAIEVQILDNTAEKYKDLKDYQFHGSAYGIAAAKRGDLKPVGEWNSQEIRCRGRHIQVTLNGKTILGTNLDEAAPNGKTLDGENHPGLHNKQGHLGFLCHDDSVSFRNVRIKDLSSGAGSDSKGSEMKGSAAKGRAAKGSGTCEKSCPQE